MKKVILFATAIAALVSCAKSEVVMEEGSPISFSPNALKTKALILPDGNAGTQQDFPTTETFNVFAFADINDGNGVNYATPLMNDVNISYQNGDWKATTGTYLWPATGSVDFYAYYPGSLNTTFDSANDPKGVSSDIISGIDLFLSNHGDEYKPEQFVKKLSNVKPEHLLGDAAFLYKQHRDRAYTKAVCTYACILKQYNANLHNKIKFVEP